MSDPGALRAQARTLREAARAIRDHSGALLDGVATVRSRYPLQGIGDVWTGPYADRYAEGMSMAASGLAGIAAAADGYATDCERRAAQLERDADAAELAASPKG